MGKRRRETIFGRLISSNIRFHVPRIPNIRFGLAVCNFLMTMREMDG